MRMTVPGRGQLLILETIPMPRATCYEAAHWTAERSKTPRRLSVPCSAKGAAGGRTGGLHTAHAAAAAGATADEPFFPLFSPAGPRAVSTQPGTSPALHDQQHARSRSQGGRGQTAHASSSCNHPLREWLQEPLRGSPASQGLRATTTRIEGKAQKQGEIDTPFFPLFSINSRPAVASPSPTSGYA
jgi:hypothetical protein